MDSPLWLYWSGFAVALVGFGWLLGAWWPNRGVVQFFPDRAALDKAHPLAEQFRDGNAIYAFWVAGQGILEYQAEQLRNGVLKEVILPHPRTEALETLTKSIETGAIYPLPGQIPINTTEFQKLGASVYWYKGFLGVSGHIGNPGRDDGWVIAEFVLPHVSPVKRESIWIEGKEAVGVWYEWYKRLLKGCEKQLST